MVARHGALQTGLGDGSRNTPAVLVERPNFLVGDGMEFILGSYGSVLDGKI